MSVRNWKVLACTGTIKVGLGVCGIHFCRYAHPLEGFVALGSTFPITIGLINFAEVEDILANNLHKSTPQKDEKNENKKD